MAGWPADAARVRPGLHHDTYAGKKSRGVVERSLASFVDALEHAFYAEELAKKNGLLQRLDPRVKIVAILPLIVIAALARRLWVIAALFAIAVAVAYAVESSTGARWRKESGWACSHSPDSSRFRPCSSLPASAIYTSAASRLDRHCTRTARRHVSHHAGGDGCDFFRFAGAVHSLEQLAEGAARAPGADRAGGGPGHDLSLHFPFAAKRARHVQVPQEPNGRPARRTGAAAGGHGQRGSADVQNAAAQRRRLPGHAFARLSGRSVCARRIPHRLVRLDHVGGVLHSGGCWLSGLDDERVRIRNSAESHEEEL